LRRHPNDEDLVAISLLVTNAIAAGIPARRAAMIVQRLLSPTSDAQVVAAQVPRFPGLFVLINITPLAPRIP
jgi:hypothetical protein